MENPTEGSHLGSQTIQTLPHQLLMPIEQQQLGMIAQKILDAKHTSQPTMRLSLLMAFAPLTIGESRKVNKANPRLTGADSKPGKSRYQGGWSFSGAREAIQSLE